MPPLLAKVHQKLDKTLDELYLNFFRKIAEKLGIKKLETDEERVDFLFGIYQEITRKS
jgi:hypothetical protein